MYKIQAKFRQSGLQCTNNKILSVTIQALSGEYQSAISNATMRAEITGMGMTFEMLIISARNMYEMRNLGKESRAENKRENEMGLATTNNNKKECFKCGQKDHFRNDCPIKGANNKTNNNLNEGDDTTCYSCGRKGYKTVNCLDNPENSSKRPQGYKPKLSLDDAKKRISKAVKSSNNQATNSNSKTEVQGSMVEVQVSIIEFKNEFSCSLINFDGIKKGECGN